MSPKIIVEQRIQKERFLDLLRKNKKQPRRNKKSKQKKQEGFRLSTTKSKNTSQTFYCMHSSFHLFLNFS